MVVAVVLAFLVVFLACCWLTMKPNNFPPGPLCLPLIGSVPFLPLKHIHFTMSRVWQKKYGPVVGLMLAAQPAIAVCGPQEVLEVLQREEFQGRHSNVLIRDRAFQKKLGVFFSDGPFWVEQRRFTLRNLRDFGFGKRSMEGLILDEVEDLIKEMRQENIFQVSRMFNISSLNLLWGMMAGIRYKRNDAELKELLQKISRFIRIGSVTGGIVSFIPILKYIAPRITGYTEMMSSIGGIQDLMRKTIRDHEKSLDENNPRDFIDTYLIEMRKQSNNKDSTFSEEGLIVTCLDLFSAGGESVNTTLGFCLLYMVLHPTVQANLHKELDTVVGRSRRPSLEDRTRLHYVEAVLTEVARCNTLAPIAPPHRATRDTSLNGYIIPKDTMVMICFTSLFEDREHWGDPEVFRPSRFLDKNGTFMKDEWMIPFGAGKRECLGKVLAQNALFLFFTSLLQDFTFMLPEGDPAPSTIPLPGILMAPKPFRVKAVKRAIKS